jgi:hypothetical protein
VREKKAEAMSKPPFLSQKKRSPKLETIAGASLSKVVMRDEWPMVELPPSTPVKSIHVQKGIARLERKLLWLEEHATKGTEISEIRYLLLYIKALEGAAGK